MGPSALQVVVEGKEIHEQTPSGPPAPRPDYLYHCSLCLPVKAVCASLHAHQGVHGNEYAGPHSSG